MQELYVKRHDEGVQRIRQAISTSKWGKGAILMDAGKRSELPTEVSGKASDLKEWLKVAPRSLSDEDQIRLSKPDLIILPDVSQAKIEQLMGSGRRLPIGQRIILIEVGYTADTKPDSKRAEKWEQHRELVDTLTHLGFKVDFNKDIHCVPLGHGGTVYKSLEMLLQQTGLGTNTVAKVMRHLEKHAVRYAHTIVVARRRLELPATQGSQRNQSNQSQNIFREIRKRKRGCG
jgi:hypothetical protein